MKEIEQSLLSEIINCDLHEQVEALSQLTIKEFEDSISREIFIALTEAITHGKKVDMLILAGILPNRIVDISKISTMAISSSRIQEYIAILKEKSFKKELVSKIDEALERIKLSNFHDEQIDIKEKLSYELSKLELFDKTEFVDLPKNIEKIEERLNNGKMEEGYSWGINSLNLMTSGIVVPRYYVIGGLKKSGKTRFVINTMKRLHNINAKMGFVSLEMPEYEVTKMLCSSFLGINDLKLRTGGMISNFEKDQFKLIKQQVNFDLFKIDCSSGLNIRQVKTRLKVMSKLGCKVVFVDYIQRILYNINKEAQELSFISNEIADATREFNIAIIALSQLQNIAEKETPNIGHLKGAGGIAEAADCIMLIDNLYRRTKKDEDKGKFDIHIEQRYGDSGVKQIAGDLGSCCFFDDQVTTYSQEQIF